MVLVTCNPWWLPVLGKRRASVRQELNITVDGNLGKANGESATETKRKGFVIHGGLQTWKSEW